MLVAYQGCLPSGYTLHWDKDEDEDEAEGNKRLCGARLRVFDKRSVHGATHPAGLLGCSAVVLTTTP